MNKQSQKKSTKCWNVSRIGLFLSVFYFREGDKRSVLLADRLFGTATVSFTPTSLRFIFFFFPAARTSVHSTSLSYLQLEGTSQLLFVPAVAQLPPLQLPLPLPRILWRIRSQPGAALMCKGRMMSHCNGHNSMFCRGPRFIWGLWTWRMELSFWKCKNHSLASTLGPGLSI